MDIKQLNELIAEYKAVLGHDDLSPFDLGVIHGIQMVINRTKLESPSVYNMHF